MLKPLLACVALATSVIVPSAGAEVPTRQPAARAAAATGSDFVEDVVAPYLAIQTALVRDELASVGPAARSLQRGAGPLGAQGKALAAAAARTAESKTLDAARAAFGDLSTALIAYADASKQSIEGKVVAFCPMAKKSWVQADGPIANPYYGKAMATCGSVTRKLKPTQ